MQSGAPTGVFKVFFCQQLQSKQQNLPAWLGLPKFRPWPLLLRPRSWILEKRFAAKWCTTRYTFGAFIITNTILVAPDYNYSIIYPKTLGFYMRLCREAAGTGSIKSATCLAIGKSEGEARARGFFACLGANGRSQDQQNGCIRLQYQQRAEIQNLKV